MMSEAFLSERKSDPGSGNLKGERERWEEGVGGEKKAEEGRGGIGAAKACWGEELGSGWQLAAGGGVRLSPEGGGVRGTLSAPSTRKPHHRGGAGGLPQRGALPGAVLQVLQECGQGPAGAAQAEPGGESPPCPAPLPVPWFSFSRRPSVQLAQPLDRVPQAPNASCPRQVLPPENQPSAFPFLPQKNNFSPQNPMYIMLQDLMLSRDPISKAKREEEATASAT